MKPIREYNEVEVYYHGINPFDFQRLLDEANGVVSKIVLYGRVFNPRKSLLKAEREQDYEVVKGQGWVYACGYEDREQATPGASATRGVTLILGWDGVSSVEPVSKGGEVLVPLKGYKVIGVVE